ncbi:MAG: hypothetical protein DRQ60_08410 [Gammaproteobacteria bacterium]|nr:MAG: hypothetical protein DRQ54_00685 [Gammaproteobacteria bacterium]RLA12680.1 MAG: hypothetical protein DRQ60_08410 [Gammaproteobacteria bacterium]RLA15856.1 MAG: hypothetical protein DRQ52_00830 [Gammaproteobacteria bacterium]
MSARLPEQFASLEGFLDQWDLPTERARHTTRLTSPIEDSQALYDALLPCIEPIAEFFGDRDLAGFSAAEQSLLNLSLSFMEVSLTVEALKSPTVPGGFAYERFEVLF